MKFKRIIPIALISAVIFSGCSSSDETTTTEATTTESTNTETTSSESYKVLSSGNIYDYVSKNFDNVKLLEVDSENLGIYINFQESNISNNVKKFLLISKEIYKNCYNDLSNYEITAFLLCNNLERKCSLADNGIVFGEDEEYKKELQDNYSLYPFLNYNPTSTEFSSTEQGMELELTRKNLTSGTIFDTLKSIYPDIEIFESSTSKGKDLMVNLNIKKSSIAEECTTYIEKTKEIFLNDAVKSYCYSMNTEMLVDNSIKAAITIIPASDPPYMTSLFLEDIDKNYTDTIRKLYNDNFSEYDQSTHIENINKKNKQLIDEFFQNQ